MSRPRCAITFAALAALPSLASAQTITDPGLPFSTHATGFSFPTGIEFLGKSPTDFFVIEKGTGRVKRSNNGVVTTPLDLNVANDSERGLLGIAVDPNFATNNFVYLYYSHTAGADGGVWDQNRLSRFLWNGTTLNPASETVLRVFGTSSDGMANGPNHDAGPITFGPDGKLYGITGDLNRNAAEQNNQGLANTTSKVGGVYRLNADGTVPSDNPFFSNGNPDFRQWYAYGIRNSFGINFDPLTSALWDTENGPASYDEVNRIDPGFNSGWNQIMGPDSRDPQNVSNLVSLPGSAYSDPEFSWLNPVAPTGITFLANSTVDVNYRDAVLVGDSNNGQLYLYRLNAARTGFVLMGGLTDLVADDVAERNSVRIGQNFLSLTELTVGPDGGIYVTSLGNTPTNGTIYRIGLKSWKLDADGSFENGANWQGGAPGSNEFANFFGTISAPRTVTYNVTKSLSGLMFNSEHRYTIVSNPPGGGVPFALSASSGTAHLRVLQGSHTLDVPVLFQSNTIVDVVRAADVMTITGRLTAPAVTITKNGPGTIEVASLVRSSAAASPSLVLNAGTFKIIPNGTNTGTSIFTTLTANGGKLDLTTNDLVITGMTRAAVEAQVDAGFGNFDWQGTGITSSTAAAQAQIAAGTALGVIRADDFGYTTFSGQTVNGTDVLVKYTYNGDSNVDGAINNDDFNLFLLGVNGAAPRWFVGDYDYSGFVNNDDFYFFLAGLFTFQDAGNTPLSADLQANLADFATANGIPLVLDPTVPEPSSLLLLAAPALLRRRRRSKLTEQFNRTFPMIDRKVAV